ncbi:MAG: DUF2218 domain-containing protein [Steroidobacteraceae bacterium]
MSGAESAAGGDGAPARHRATASVALATPARSMNRLAKHFSHRLPVSRAEDHARIDFPEGTCQLRAEATVLRIDIESATAATLERYREVVARHLAQVTPDEVVAVHWQETGPAATA